MYLDKSGNVVPGLSTQTHLASGVPGSVAGMLDVLEQYGTMSRKQILAPAIRLAKDGFDLNDDLATDFQQSIEDFRKHPGSARVFIKADGSAYQQGDRFRQPELAKTLELIAAKGKDGFYAGKTADLLVAEMQRGGGLISAKDLADYRSVWRDPVSGTYRGYGIYSMAPPSSGGVLLVQMLNMLEPYDLKALGIWLRGDDPPDDRSRTSRVCRSRRISGRSRLLSRSASRTHREDLRARAVCGF